MVKSFETTDQPVRCAKFVVRKQWIVAGSDDMFIRVFNYNTMEKIKEFEAHVDYIRSLEVHPTLPYVLSSSDDMQVKLWDWEKDWSNTQVFEGHGHYVMCIKFNPKDTNTFATASLDTSVKVWSLGSPLPNYSLEGHERGVNCLDYFVGGEKPYIISGADDQTIKIWDYQTKTCVQTLESHTNNISSVCFHPKLPIIISGSEDGTVRIWHSNTYRLETTLNYGMERAWSVAVAPNANKVAVGYDEGTIVIQLGQEEPVVSMDASGKILMANNNDVVSTTIRNTGETAVDGEAIDLNFKDLGSCEIYPQTLKHNSNGRFVVACGDGEYIIYTAQALRNKSFGSALDFVWSSEGTGDYAVRESTNTIKIFKNFKEVHMFKPPFVVENMFGGPYIALQGNEFVLFVDWDMAKIVMRIDVVPRKTIWSQNGELVTLVCEESYFVLQCDRDAIADAFAGGTADEAEGVESSFELLHEISESVGTGQWVGDCFLYTNKEGTRINYYVGGEVITLCHLDKPMYMLGYVARENRVYLIDKNKKISSYKLLEGILQYQTAVVRQDFELANEILPSIPREQYNNIARFLEAQGFKDVALQVADDPDLRFDLALQLEKFQIALEIMKSQDKAEEEDTVETQTRWKQLGDLALGRGDLVLAEECAKNAKDLSGLLLMYTCSGSAESLESLQELATAQKKFNISFICHFLRNETDKCVQILEDAGRIAEAAFFVRTYMPSRIGEYVEKWRALLPPKVGQSIANPQENPDQFPNYELLLQAEQLSQSIREKGLMPASKYKQAISGLDLDLVELVKNRKIDVPGQAKAQPPATPPATSAVPAQTQSPKPEPTQPPQETAAPPTPTPTPAPVAAEPPPPETQQPGPVVEAPKDSLEEDGGEDGLDELDAELELDDDPFDDEDLLDDEDDNGDWS